MIEVFKTLNGIEKIDHRHIFLQKKKIKSQRKSKETDSEVKPYSKKKEAFLTKNNKIVKPTI